MTTSLAFSLHHELTHLSVPQEEIPGAMSFSALLLHGIGREVCDSATSNTQCLYQTISRARDVGNTILDLIAKVGKEDENAQDVIAAFTTYSEMVGPLEDALWRIALLTFDEPNLDSQPAKPLDLVKPFNHWSTNRAAIRESLNMLYDGTKWSDTRPPTDVDTADLKRYDDLAWFTQALQSLSSHKLAQGTTTLAKSIISMGEVYQKVLEALRTLSKLDEGLIVLCTRTAMVFLAAVSLHDNADAEFKQRLKNRTKTWKVASEIINKLLALTGGNEAKLKADLPDVQKEWTTFEEYLMGSSLMDFLPLVRDLLKHVGKIRRHYYSQAVAVVMLAIDLESNTRDKGTERRTDQVDEAIEAASKALVSASEAATTIDFAQSDWAVLTENPTGVAFTDAEAKMKAAFVGNGLTDKTATLMEEARKKDEGWVKELASHYTSLKARAEKSATAELTVTVKLSKGKPDKGAKESALGSFSAVAGLDAILRKISPDNKILQQHPRFYNADGTSEIGPGTKLSTLAPNEKVTVHLVVDDTAVVEGMIKAATSNT